MAKKILSILCALAMMVTMVSVAAFSASAAPEGYADFDGLADMTLAVDTAKQYNTSSDWYAKNGSGWYKSDLNDGMTLVVAQTLATLTSADTYDIYDEFEMQYFVYRLKNDGNGGSIKYQADGSIAYGYYNAVTLGKLEIRFYSNATPKITCDIVYDGTVLATGTPTVETYNTAVDAATNEAYEAEFDAAFKDSPFGAGDRIKLEVNIAYKDGKIVASYGPVGDVANQFTVEADLADADLTDTSLVLTLAEYLNKSTALWGLTGTYSLPVDEGGETPDPEVPTTGTFVGLENATVNYDVLADWSRSGEFDSAVFGETILVAGKKATATFADNYNIGDEFEFTYKISSIYNNTVGDGVVIKLGKLSISVENSKSGPHYKASIAYNGETLATSAESEYPWSAGVYKEDEVADDATYVSTFLDEIHSNVHKDLYKNITTVGKQEFFVHTVTCTYKDGKVSVTLFSGPTTTVEAQIDNADFSDAAMSIEVKSSANWYHKAIHGFTGTYSLPVDDGEETTDPLAPTGVYPTLNSDLTLNVIYANAADIKDNVTVTATVDGKSQTVGLTEKGGHLVASFDFLTPDQFGSEITLEAVDTNGVAETYSTTYSVKQYCKNMMDNDSSSDELKALCMALLQFGGKVQALDGTDTITADLDDYAAYAPTAWTKGTAAWSYTGDQAIKFSGSNLNFADEIGINVYFTADGDAADYKVVSTFGNVSDVVVDGNQFMATIRISSSMLSEQTAITVKDAATNEVVSETFTLSVEDYANGGNWTGAKLDCVVALMTYGDAAAAYGNSL